MPFANQEHITVITNRIRTDENSNDAEGPPRQCALGRTRGECAHAVLTSINLAALRGAYQRTRTNRLYSSSPICWCLCNRVRVTSKFEHDTIKHRAKHMKCGRNRRNRNGCRENSKFVPERAMQKHIVERCYTTRCVGKQTKLADKATSYLKIRIDDFQL